MANETPEIAPVNAKMLFHPRPRTLSFDCYGTLVDWKQGVVQTLQHLFASQTGDFEYDSLWREWQEQQHERIQGGYRPYRQIMTESLQAVATAHHLSIPEGESDALGRALPGWPPFPDVRPALKRLKQRFDLVILSNIDDQLLSETVAHLGVSFDDLITAEQVGTYKPDPNNFQHLLDRVRGKKEELLHVAYGYTYDILPCSQLEIQSVWVNRSRRSRPTGARPTAEVHDLAELASLLLS